MRQRVGKHVTDNSTQFALREIRGDIRGELTQPSVLIVLVAVSGIVALAGPFETDTLLRLAPRFAYWLVLVAGSYACGVAGSIIARHAVRRPIPQMALACALVGCAVSTLVLGLNWLVFAFFPALAQLPTFLGTIFAISAIVTISVNLLTNQRQADATPAADSPPLLNRLPFDKRGPLLALSVEDHYVQVRTGKGTDMLLMRLSDAIQEVGATPGAQVHRSHWVAFASVTRAERKGDRAILTLIDGSEIPVSRANIQKIREAGLLPGGRNG